jgi:Na+-transporting NADH:ubiquinone oxidoreductase subunit NqrF
LTDSSAVARPSSSSRCCPLIQARLVQGKVKELTDKSYLLSAEELQQNYILACQSQARSDLVIEVALREGAAAPGGEHRCLHRGPVAAHT